LPGKAGERTVEVRLHNTASVPAIEAKIILERADSSQVLPAYYSDNYISLLPGEERTVTVKFPAEQPSGKLRLRLRGWNVVKNSSDVTVN
jgi:hypothetical protein